MSFRLSCLCLLSLITTGVAQAQMRSFGALKSALNRRDPSLLAPYLAREFRVGDLADEVAVEVMAQFVRGYAGNVEEITVRESHPDSAGTEVRATVLSGGAGRDYLFRLDRAGRFVEIGMVRVSPASRALYPAAENLVLPDTLICPFSTAGGLMLVTAAIDGRTGTFVLDNGAPFLVLNLRLADTAGMSADSGGVAGIMGQIPGAHTVNVQRFEWNGYRSTNHRALAIDLGELERETGRELAGLIGYSVLRGYEITFDATHGRLRLVKLDASGNPVVAVWRERPVYEGSLKMQGHLPVIIVRIGDGSYAMGIDCGAETNMLREDLEARLRGLITVTGEEMLSGADNIRKSVKKIRVGSLRFGRLNFRRMDAVLAGMGYLNGMLSLPLDGLLGYEFLSRYKTVLNPRKRTVGFYAN